ncbi:MAG: DUF177 domain-containing protein [candidate division Zixibacteria bacterium]|nr:DUF177 domain-containing protein [candidate division Zixibacteria bacterium]
MKIDIKALKENKNYIEFEELPDSIGFKVKGMELSWPVQLKLEVVRSGEHYICEGKIITRIGFECSRCLMKYNQSIESEIRFILKEDKDQIILESDEGENQVQSGRFFSLDGLVRENIVLSLPLKPLCSENCKGLCPSCGANWNLTLCECKKEVIDPRWEKLKNLKLEDRDRE